jgi:hypothetical protein
MSPPNIRFPRIIIRFSPVLMSRTGRRIEGPPPDYRIRGGLGSCDAGQLGRHVREVQRTQLPRVTTPKSSSYPVVRWRTLYTPACSGDLSDPPDEDVSTQSRSPMTDRTVTATASTHPHPEDQRDLPNRQAYRGSATGLQALYTPACSGDLSDPPDEDVSTQSRSPSDLSWGASRPADVSSKHPLPAHHHTIGLDTRTIPAKALPRISQVRIPLI